MKAEAWMPSSRRFRPLGGHAALNRRDIALLAEDVRHPTSGAVDVDEIARQLGVAVVKRSLPPTLWGAATGPESVFLNSRLRPADQRFALAHELGHILVRRGRAVLDSAADEEEFADVFARELLLPIREIDRLPDLTPAQLRARFGVTPAVVAEQLARVDPARLDPAVATP